MIQRIDRELDLPVHAAKRIKEKIKILEGENAKLRQENEELKQKVSSLEFENQLLKDRVSILEDGNQSLRDQVSSLQAENDSLKQRIAEIENGSLGIRKVSDEAGDRIELAPGREFITQLTADGVLKPIEPNALIIGDQENYLSDVITANITIASLSRFKKNIRELDPSMLEIELPAPKMYERAEGRRRIEIGFIAEEMPDFLRRGNGYDLKALIAILAWKVKHLEQAIKKMTKSEKYPQQP